MSYTFDWLAVPNIVSLVFSAFLAIFVLKTNPKKDYNRVFALMFTDVSITAFSGTMVLFSTDPNALIWKDLLFLSCLPIYGLVAYFVSIFPRRCTVFGKHRYATALLFLPSVLVGGLYIKDRSPSIAGVPLEGTWRIVTITSLFFALVVLVRSHLYAISETERIQVKYVLVAFAIQAIFCVAHFAFPFIASLSTVYVAVAAASVLVDVLFVVLIAYAILKYQLFDIEVKMKRGIKYSIVMTSLAALLILFNESLEFFLMGSIFSEPVFSILGAFLLAVVFIPVNNWAQETVDKIFPNVSNSEQHYNLKKTEIYRAALEQAWVDGNPSEKEKAMLTRLREKLGLSERDHNKLEAETKTKLHDMHARIKGSMNRIPQ